ncbi:MAG: HEAT repeat domain-containing protein, partial [Planctomycetota bacterium]
MLRTGLCVLLLGFAVLAQSPDERTLARYGVQPDAPSLRRYLRSLVPEPRRADRMRMLVEDLGAPSPEVRDAALRELATYGDAAISPLRRAAESGDPEVRRRARTLLKHAASHRRPGLLHAALRTIQARKLPGLVPEILRVIPHARDSFARTSARRALVATAVPEDVPVLLRAATEGPSDARPAAFLALRTVDREAARPVLARALEDSSAAVRAAAARELAEMGDR